jgi:hypothetical protein
LHKCIAVLVLVVLSIGVSGCTSAPAAAPPSKPAATTAPPPQPAATAAPVAKVGAPTAVPTAASKPAAPFTVNKPVNSTGVYQPANTLIVYGDTVLFGEANDPDTCIVRSRYKAGESVGFRMTALDPQTGKYDDGAEMTVTVNYGGKTEDISMRYRGSGSNAHPGMWTGKWAVPDDAPVGVVKYTVVAKDPAGRSGTWQPFNVEQSMLTIVK